MGDSMPTYVLLNSRGVLAVTGKDRVGFLQGLTSNDVALVSQHRTVFSTFLTPQGKFLHDFFMAARGDALLLDCEADRRDDLMRRLKLYRLRSKVEIRDTTDDLAVAAVTGEEAAALFGLSDPEAGQAIDFDGGIAYVDPRHMGLGLRVILPRPDAERALAGSGATAGEPGVYDHIRLSLGIPDGSRDLIVEKSTLLESNYDALNAISWDKGCYLGQELTARMKYRGLVKKRLMPVAIDGPMPPAGTPISLDGREVGEMRSGNNGLGIALLRLDAVERAVEPGAAAMKAESATVTVRDVAIRSAQTQVPRSPTP